MAAFPLPATRASCQPPFGVVPRQRHTTWNSHSPVTTTLNLRAIRKGILRLNYTIQGKFSTGIFVGAARRLGSLD